MIQFDKKKVAIGLGILALIGLIALVIYALIGRDKGDVPNCLDSYQVFKASCVPLSVSAAIIGSDPVQATAENQQALLDFLTPQGIFFDKEEALIDPEVTDKQMAKIADFVAGSDLFPTVIKSNVAVSVNKPLEQVSGARLVVSALSRVPLEDDSGVTSDALEILDLDRVLVPLSAYPCIKKCSKINFVGDTAPPSGTASPV